MNKKCEKLEIVFDKANVLQIFEIREMRNFLNSAIMERISDQIIFAHNFYFRYNFYWKISSLTENDFNQMKFYHDKM